MWLRAKLSHLLQCAVHDLRTVSVVKISWSFLHEEIKCVGKFKKQLLRLKILWGSLAGFRKGINYKLNGGESCVEIVCKKMGFMLMTFD